MGDCSHILLRCGKTKTQISIYVFYTRKINICIYALLLLNNIQQIMHSLTHAINLYTIALHHLLNSPQSSIPYMHFISLKQIIRMFLG